MAQEGQEKLTLVKGKEQRLHFAEAVKKRHSMSKLKETQVRRHVLREGVTGQIH